MKFLGARKLSGSFGIGVRIGRTALTNRAFRRRLTITMSGKVLKSVSTGHNSCRGK